MPGSSAPFFQCDQCGKKYAWKSELAGKRVRCKCGEPITVPITTLPPPTVAPAIIVSPPVSAAPVTAIPVPAQLVAPSIEYAGAVKPQVRSRYVRWLAIVAIFYAGLSGLYSGGHAFLWWKSSASSVPPPVTPVQVVAPNLLSFLAIHAGAVPNAFVDGSIDRPGTVRASARKPIVASIALTGPSAAARRDEFDALLAEEGTRMTGGLPPDVLAGAIRRVAPSTPGVDDPAVGSVLVSVPGGRVVLACDHGVFASGQFVEIVAGDVICAGGQSPRLTVPAIDRAIGQLRTDVPAITDPEASFVARQLAGTNGYPLASPGQILQPPHPMTNVSIGPDNVLRLTIGRRSFFVLPDGRGIDQAKVPMDAAGQVLSVANARPWFRPMMPGNWKLMRGLAVESGYAVCLAIFLLVAAVMALVRPPLGMRLMLWFAGLKTLSLIAWVVLSIWFFDSVRATPVDASIPVNISDDTQELISLSAVQIVFLLAIVGAWLWTAGGRLGRNVHGSQT